MRIDALEQLAQFLLKDHHDHDQEDGEETLKDPCGHLQIEILGDDVDRSED
jgi:hypothetical protein